MSPRVKSKKVLVSSLLTLCLILGLFTTPAIARQRVETARGYDNAIAKHKNIFEVRLDGATEYEALEVMSKVLNTVPGVLKAKRYGANVVPSKPKASWSTWRVTYEGTDPSRLQSNIMNMINQILDAGGKLTLKGVSYRYTRTEVNLLMKIRTGSASSHMVQFVFDR